MSIFKQYNRFQKEIKSYYKKYKRDLPWRRTRNPYRILVSEVMLQQTQVGRVERYYKNFLKEFPTIKKLAATPLADVLSAWQGLGYNRRALMLKKFAERVTLEYHGKLPADIQLLADLPGIGINTAGAIAAFAFNMPSVFIETNIRRAYIHSFFPGKKKVADSEIIPLIKKTLDRKNPREWYYALMDYGAYLARHEKENPNRRSHHYTLQSRFEGSDRQIRAGIVRHILAKKRSTLAEISRELKKDPERVGKIATALVREGLIKKAKNHFTIPL